MCHNGELCIWFDKLKFCSFFFHFMLKLYPPVCSTVPASLQAREGRLRDCNLGQGRAKREGVISYDIRFCISCLITDRWPSPGTFTDIPKGSAVWLFIFGRPFLFIWPSGFGCLGHTQNCGIHLNIGRNLINVTQKILLYQFEPVS